MSQSKRILTAGKSGPAFTAEKAFMAMVASVPGGLTRTEFAQIAMMCLDEALTSRQVGVMDETQQNLEALGLLGQPGPKPTPKGLPPGCCYQVAEQSDGTWDAYYVGGLWATDCASKEAAELSLWDEYARH